MLVKVVPIPRRLVPKHDDHDLISVSTSTAVSKTNKDKASAVKTGDEFSFDSDDENECAYC